MADLSGPLRRKNHGRNHSYHFGNHKVPGVTTIIGVRDKANLKGWAAGCAAEVVANAARVKDGRLLIDGDELWAELRRLDTMLPSKPSLPKLVDALKWRHNKERDAAANRGTEVHRLAEKLTAGEQVNVPDELVGCVDSYIDWFEAWGPTNTRSEVSVGARRHGGWGGTLDLLCEIEGLGRCLVDIKTSGSGVYGDTALQLAGYRYAEVCLDDDGNEAPMPEVDWCGVLWVRADGCDLYPYRVGPAEKRLFEYCRAVYALWLEPFAGEKYPDMRWGDSVKGEAITPDQVRGAA